MLNHSIMPSVLSCCGRGTGLASGF